MSKLRRFLRHPIILRVEDVLGVALLFGLGYLFLWVTP